METNNNLPATMTSTAPGSALLPPTLAELAERPTSWEDCSKLPVLSDEDRGHVRNALEAVRSFLQPALEDEIVTALTELDVLPRKREGAREAQFKMATYVKALADLPKWCITRSIGELVKTEDWFPVPAHIRRLAEKHMAKAMWKRTVLTEWLARRDTPPPEPEDRASPEDVKRIKAEVAAEIARKRGVPVSELSPDVRAVLGVDEAQAA